LVSHYTEIFREEIYANYFLVLTAGNA